MLKCVMHFGGTLYKSRKESAEMWQEHRIILKAFMKKAVSIMCNPGTSAYFLLKGCPQVTQCCQVCLSPLQKIAEANFPEQWVSSLPPPATGTPHKSLLRGIYGPYFCRGRKGVQDATGCYFLCYSVPVSFDEMVFQSAKCCLEGPGKSQNGVKAEKVLRLMFRLTWILTCTAQEKTLRPQCQDGV